MCNCGNNCQQGYGCLCQIVLPDNPVEIYQSININTLGIGFYDSTDSNTFQFRGAYSASASLLITLDAGNNALRFELDGAAIVADLPSATTVQRGVGETSTDIEAQNKASTAVFLTPSNLAALGASLTFAGLVELATAAETQAGVSVTLAVTPAGLASVIALQQGTQVWADAVARLGATPDFDGQFGVQIDSDTIFVATGTGVGDFDKQVFVLGNTNTSPASSTVIDLSGETFSITNGIFSLSGVVNVGSGLACTFNFGALAVLQDAGVTVPALSVLTTSGTPGQFNSSLINTFVSNANVQTYGLPTSTLARTTFATYAGQVISNPPTQAEVQALDNAVVIASQRLGALITDLMATLKPHA